MTTLENKVQLSDQDYNAQLFATLKTKSAVIRYLAAEGWKRGRIAKSFPGDGILYQHVRNVLTQPMKKKVEPTTEE